MKTLVGRYLSVLVGLVLASQSFIATPATPIPQLGWADLAHGAAIAIGLLLIMYGMFASGLPRPGEKRRLAEIGPTLLGTLGSASMVIAHDDGVGRIIVIGLLVFAVALPGVVSRLRTPVTSGQ